MGIPLELRAPMLRHHQDGDLVVLRRQAGAEPGLRAQRLGQIGEFRRGSQAMKGPRVAEPRGPAVTLSTTLRCSGVICSGVRVS